jgi:hypothetical protein
MITHSAATCHRRLVPLTGITAPAVHSLSNGVQ